MVFGDDETGDAETQTGSLAHRLGGEEGFEDPFSGRFVRAGTGEALGAAKSRHRFSGYAYRMRRFIPLQSLGVLLVMVSLLTGCSATQLAYRNADFLLTRYALRTLDLNGEQKRDLENRLERWLVWHREQQAPRLLSRLSAARHLVTDGLTREESGWLITTLRGSYKEVVAGLVPVAAETLLSLSPDQIDELERSFREENEKFHSKVLAEEAVRREQDRFEWFEKQLERWVGDLNPEQAAWLKTQLLRYPSTAELWQRYREVQQDRLVALLRRGAGRAELIDFLHGWSVERRDLPPRYARARKELYDELPERLVEFDRLLTDRQRRYLNDRLRFFEEVVAEMVLVPKRQSAAPAQPAS
ncbi:MAG: hypothetical protein Kow006_08100 [Gammaproteobacteria bacterium]